MGLAFVFPVGLHNEQAAISKWELLQSQNWGFRTKFYSTRSNYYTDVIPYSLINNPNYVPPINLRPWMY